MKRLAILLCLIAWTASAQHLIVREVETIDYNPARNEANWAEWTLQASDIGDSGRCAEFFTDTNLPAGYVEVKPSDYDGCGYDRGHLCPSDDRSSDTNRNRAVFWMSNIIPQKPGLNRGPWKELETYCRQLAKEGQHLDIAAGPGAFTTNLIAGKVAVPAWCWKVVMSETDCVAMVEMPQDATGSWTNYTVSYEKMVADMDELMKGVK